MTHLPLLGILIVVAGFALRLNPMLVVTAAGLATGLLAGMSPLEVVAAFGKAFNDNRIIALVWIVLPAIGLLERFGLQQRAAAVIRGFRGATAGKLLLLYLAYRQVTAAASAIGATSGRAAGRGRRPHQGDDRGDRQRRAVLRRGRVPGDRLDRPDPAGAGGGRLRAHPARAGAVGDPERDRRVRHPRRAAVAVGPAEGAIVITLAWLYVPAGLMFVGVALRSALDRANPTRFGTAAFWALMALSLLAGDRIGDLGNGVLVLALAALAGFGLVGKGAPHTTSEPERERFAARLGNRLFLPALIIPATALAGTLAYNYTPLGQAGWIEPKRETYVFLVLGVLLALAAIFAWLRPPALAPVEEGRRLLDAIGWAAVLPQLLAALGAVFAAAGVGEIVGALVRQAIPQGSVFLAVAVFALGMAAFTIVMGNAFAAFPVMAAAVGVPLLIVDHGGDPAVIGAVGMLAGFCGTLMTPMAANFNLVPAALLELRNPYGVIRAQIPTALPMLAANIAILYGFSGFA
jgi:uncharacterized membrane protein